MDTNLETIRVEGGARLLIDSAGNAQLVDKDGRISDLRRSDVHVQTRDLGASDVHIDAALSVYAAGYALQGSIADAVAPIVPSDKLSNKYFTYDKDDAFQQADGTVALDGNIQEVVPRLSNTQFITTPYSLASRTDMMIIKNADAPLNPRQAGLTRCMNALLLARELRVKAACVAGNFTSFTSAVAAANKWNGGVTSDPIADIHTGMAAALMPITGIAMSEQTFFAMLRNPNSAKYSLYKDVPTDLNSPAGLATANNFGLPPIYVGKMKAKSATAGTYGYAWGNDVVLLHQEAGMTLDGQSISTLKTFRYVEGAAGLATNGFRVRTYFDPRRGQDGSEVSVVSVNEVVKVTGAPSGYLLTAAYQ